MSAATDPASALAACVRLRVERDAALAKVSRVEALAREWEEWSDDADYYGIAYRLTWGKVAGHVLAALNQEVAP